MNGVNWPLVYFEIDGRYIFWTKIFSVEGKLGFSTYPNNPGGFLTLPDHRLSFMWKPRKGEKELESHKRIACF